MISKTYLSLYQDIKEFNYGQKWSAEIENEFINHCKNPLITGISILGGEPFQQECKEMYSLLQRIKNEVRKPIWVWTGYTFEELLKNENHESLLDYIDVLVDGKFEISKKDLSLKFKGSSNQRVINVKESLAKHKIIITN